MVHTLLPLLVVFVQASFDCKRAQHPVEKKICQDVRLSGLDDSLGRKWKQVQASFAGPDLALIKGEQKSWMAGVRGANPSTDSLRAGWRRRIEELEFKLRFKDLRSLVDAGTMPGRMVMLEARGDCMGVPDERGELALHGTSDGLELEFLRATDRLRFSVSSNVGQHMCNVCGIEGEAVRVKSPAGGQNPSRWAWKSGEAEDSTSAEFQLFGDRALVLVKSTGESPHCGMGAGFPDTLKFRAAGIR